MKPEYINLLIFAISWLVFSWSIFVVLKYKLFHKLMHLLSLNSSYLNCTKRDGKMFTMNVCHHCGQESNIRRDYMTELILDIHTRDNLTPAKVALNPPHLPQWKDD
jgi:hypothetical protein